MSDDDKEKKGERSHDEAFWGFTRAREAKGGIKSQQPQRGKRQYKWWGARWLAVLDSFDIESRLQRARAYARKGQVLSIDIEPGVVRAAVQGSRAQPYDVTIKMATLREEDWVRLADLFAAKPLFGAKLLAGDMPPQIEEAFSALKLKLFPTRQSDLSTNCTCPDWSNPCKHIAAVYYLLAEEFDRDPFLIFRLRGLSEDQLHALLDRRLSQGESGPSGDEPQPLPAAQAQLDELLSNDPARFYGAGTPLPPPGEFNRPSADATIARAMGNFPFWRGDQDLWRVLEHLYRQASRYGSTELADRLAENTSEGGLVP